MEHSPKVLAGPPESDMNWPYLPLQPVFVCSLVMESRLVTLTFWSLDVLGSLPMALSTVSSVCTPLPPRPAHFYFRFEYKCHSGQPFLTLLSWQPIFLPLRAYHIVTCIIICFTSDFPIRYFHAGMHYVCLAEFCVPSVWHGAMHTVGVQRGFAEWMSHREVRGPGASSEVWERLKKQLGGLWYWGAARRLASRDLPWVPQKLPGRTIAARVGENLGARKPGPFQECIFVRWFQNNKGYPKKEKLISQ